MILIGTHSCSALLEETNPMDAQLWFAQQTMQIQWMHNQWMHNNGFSSLNVG